MVNKCENQAANRNQDHGNKHNIYPQIFPSVRYLRYLKPGDLHTHISQKDVFRRFGFSSGCTNTYAHHLLLTMPLTLMFLRFPRGNAVKVTRSFAMMVGQCSRGEPSGKSRPTASALRLGRHAPPDTRSWISPSPIPRVRGLSTIELRLLTPSALSVLSTTIPSPKVCCRPAK